MHPSPSIPSAPRRLATLTFRRAGCFRADGTRGFFLAAKRLGLADAARARTAGRMACRAAPFESRVCVPGLIRHTEKASDELHRQIEHFQHIQVLFPHSIGFHMYKRAQNATCILVCGFLF